MNSEGETDRFASGPEPDAPPAAATAQPTALGGEPGPSPAEVDAMAWASIDEASRRKRCAGARGLAGFVRDVAHAAATPKGDERTNVIDQGERATYAFSRDQLRALLGHLEACRLEGTATHFSERQGTAAAPRSGLMLDFDIVTAARRPALVDRHYYRLAGALAAALQRDVDFAAGGGEPGRPPAEARLHVFFTVKPEALPLPPAPGGEARYKFGLHVLVPGVRLGRAYKKWLLRRFRDDPAVLATLAELGAVGDAAECLDQNSASVPVLYFGSCKRGAVPYGLGAALEVTLDLGCAGWTPAPVVRKLPAEDLAGFNLAAELGLVAEAEYADGREPLVRKRDYEARPEVAAAARDWGERAAGGLTPPDELLAAEHGLSTLTLHNAEARHVHALLDLLAEPYYTERNRWRDVIFALANSGGEAYKPLAVWFSHRCPAQWADGGLAALDALWDDAIARRGAVAAPLTVGSIRHWARECDPRRYAEVMERSYFTMLTTYVYEHGGRLQHYMVAKVLREMLGALFVVDLDAGPRGAQSYCWYQFVVPGTPMRAGEVWKWRREADPDDVHVYMSEKFTRVLDQIGDHIAEKLAAAADEGAAKYYKGLERAFAGSKAALYNDTFKNGVVRQANYLFRRRGFADALDRSHDLLGVANGVLRVGARCELIDRFHEFPVSRFTPVAYRRFDPADPWHRLVIDALADIIVEPDARLWIIFHAAQGIYGGAKEGLFLLWMGGGQNGKTSVLRWFAKALGPYAAKFNIQLMCAEREDPDRPNSAMMRFEHLNYAYAEESNKAQVLNVARMKEMVNAGEVSGRDLNARQKEFTMRANLVAASQYSFIVNTTDHGTWRRLAYYESKAKFSRNPDPANPYEKKDNQDFVRKYPTDPEFQSAVLAVLAHFYERLENEYGGELKNVRSPTIERETEAFRVSQDSLHRWICETIVVSPDCEVEYPLGVLSGYYTDWYQANIDNKRLVASDNIKALESSAVGKYLKPAPNRALVMRGCRVLLGDDTRLRPGEEYINVVAMRGHHSAGEWAEACAAADRGGANDGLPWWAARPRAEPRAKPPPAGADDLAGLFDGAADDAAVLRAERDAARPPGPAPGWGPRPLRDADVEAILGGAGASARGAAGGYTLDDMYGDGGDGDGDGGGDGDGDGGGDGDGAPGLDDGDVLGLGGAENEPGAPDADAGWPGDAEPYDEGEVS